MTDPNAPVLVEWYTYRRIPRQHHAVVVTAAQAALWQQQRLKIFIHQIDPEIINERRSKVDRKGS
jgi:hypothetical protein